MGRQRGGLVGVMSTRGAALVTVGVFAAIVVVVIIGPLTSGGPVYLAGGTSRTGSFAHGTATSTTAVPSTTTAPPTTPAAASIGTEPSSSAPATPVPTPTITRTPVPATRSSTVAPSAPSQNTPSYNYASVAPPPPAADIPPNPDFSAPCHAASQQSTCITDVVDAINNAHVVEGIPPVQLPSGFDSLSPANQVFVLVNLERVDRNLSPITGELASLDQLSQVGAQGSEDPEVPSGGLPGVPVSAWGANWASSGSDVDAVYEWMYEDGLGGPNRDCTTTNLSRCWDHRAAILGFQNDMTAYGGSLSFGAATVSTGSNTSVAMLITWSRQTPSGYYYSWSQAVAGGAT
jgi:hypothetical protein